jgi:hypothetical protein
MKMRMETEKMFNPPRMDFQNEKLEAGKAAGYGRFETIMESQDTEYNDPIKQQVVFNLLHKSR